jgi:hypothetical protein
MTTPLAIAGSPSAQFDRFRFSFERFFALAAFESGADWAAYDIPDNENERAPH